jgi:hypothetical protein
MRSTAKRDAKAPAMGERRDFELAAALACARNSRVRGLPWAMPGYVAAVVLALLCAPFAPH